MHRVGGFIRGMIRGVAAKVPRSKAILSISIILIFLVAFLIRLSPIFVYDPLLKEFDPYYFYRNVQYIISNGFGPWFSWRDFAAWYPWGRDVPGSTYPGMIFTAVFIYYALNAIGLTVSSFAVCYYMPVFFGALTPIITYFIGKELYDSRSGLLAAFFIAVSPAIIQRQVPGFFDNEPFGIFIMLFTFYFFIRSLKRGSAPSAIMAGLFLGYICLSWGTYIYVIDIFALFTFIMLITRRYSARLFNTYNITMLIGLFIAVLAPRNGLKILTMGEVLPALFLMGILILYETSKYLARIPIVGRVGKRIARVNPFLLFTVIAIGFMVILTLSPIGGKFFTVIDPLFREQTQRILASVGEHQPTGWGLFFWELGIVAILGVVGVYFSFRRLHDEDILMIMSVITLTYFAGSMVRIVITLSPILAILAGYGLSSALRPFGKIMSTPREQILHRRRVRITPTLGRDYSAVAFLMIGIILFSYGTTIVMPTPHSTIPLIQQWSPPEILPQGQYPDWLEALSWLNNEAPGNAVVASWWDYGYFITCVGNRTSVDDNGTVNSTQIALVGLAFMETNETASLQIFKRFNTRYVLVYFGHMQSGLAGDEGKWIWMLRIAADHFASQGLIDENQYYNSTSGLILPKFFNSTLYRLMFNKEPRSESYLDYWLVAYMGTSAFSYNQISTEAFPAVGIKSTDTNLQSLNSYWASQISGFTNVEPRYDEYGPRFFKEAYVSVNHLVKIYEVDYTPLEMTGNLAIANDNATKLYTNGTATVTVTNTGASGSPAIPLNAYTDWTGKTHYGTLWLNNTYSYSLNTIQVWNSTASSWKTYSETFYVNPGETVTFRINTHTCSNGSITTFKFISSFDDSIYAMRQVTAVNS